MLPFGEYGNIRRRIVEIIDIIACEPGANVRLGQLIPLLDQRLHHRPEVIHPFPAELLLYKLFSSTQRQIDPQ